MPTTATPEIETHLKQLYAKYRLVTDPDAKGPFFSQECHQICRPTPSYAAQNRDTIVRYLREAAAGGVKLASANDDDGEDEEAYKPEKKKGRYTIRPLREGEFEFGTDEQVAPAGYASADETRKQAEREGWAGMRVDLWGGAGVGEPGETPGMLVKVQYWWRREEDGWIQILHDIMYFGLRDGSEGVDGEILD